MQVYLVKRPPRAIIVLLKSVRWHVARLSGGLVDRLLTQKGTTLIQIRTAMCHAIMH